MEPTLSQLTQAIEDSFRSIRFVALLMKIKRTGMRIGGLVGLNVQEDNTGLTLLAIALAKKKLIIMLRVPK